MICQTLLSPIHQTTPHCFSHTFLRTEIDITVEKDIQNCNSVIPDKICLFFDYGNLDIVLEDFQSGLSWTILFKKKPFLDGTGQGKREGSFITIDVHM